MKHTVLWPETNKQTNKGRKEEGWWVWNNIARLNYYYYSFYILFCIVFIVIVSFSFSFYFYYFAN